MTMLSDFHTALAVSKGTGLLPRDSQPDETHSGHTVDGYVLRDAHGAVLCEVPLEALRSWLPSDGIDHPLSIEAIIGAPTGERWEYCFLLVEFAPKERGSVLERVLINGQPISTSTSDGPLPTAQFHELLNLMGDRGWELVTSALRNLDDQGFGRSYSLIFKRRPVD
ncbi:hypothetical protein [Cyanobium sp. ATX 6F1]|uniref:hypothetical protein n=2 Tax=unclassified Cyanobium TaxID=2627006 RepID=UPI0020CF06D8|nr:hypothetical protein [Cyanobium sp. ATX 6F1]MCP9915655.1 hypothetical protein [Cyanobium sp. ATX 6F1]